MYGGPVTNTCRLADCDKPNPPRRHYCSTEHAQEGRRRSQRVEKADVECRYCKGLFSPYHRGDEVCDNPVCRKRKRRDDLRDQQGIGVEPVRSRQSHPTGYEPGYELNGDTGTVTSEPTTRPPDRITSWDWLLERWHLDTEEYEVIEPVNIRTWLGGVGNGETQEFYYYKASVRKRREISTNPDRMKSLRATVQNLKPRRWKQGDLSDRTAVLVMADLQLGKADGDGTDGTVARFFSMLETAAATCDRLASRGVDELLIPWLGDIVENVDGHYCVSVDTPILTDDLRWVPAGELKVGDGLYALNEEQSGPTGRRFEKAQVTHHVVEPAETVRVALANGESLICTPEHPLLAHRFYGSGFTKAEWIAARDLTTEHRVAKMFEVWEPGTTFDHGWLSGIYDGEGHLSAGVDRGAPNILGVAQKEGPVLDRMARLLGEFGFKFTAAPARENGVVSIRIRGGYHEILRALGTLRPNRLIGKIGEPWARVKEWVPVASVTPAGENLIARMSTSSRTYFSAGYASHNSMQGFTADRNLNEQVETAALLYVALNKTLAPMFPRVLNVVVPGNHGEVRKDGKAHTDFGDNHDVTAPYLGHQAVIERLPHVRFVRPEKPLLSTTVEVRGRIHGFLHGHQGKVSGPTAHQRIVEWHRRQAAGQRAMGDAEFVWSAHYHHLSIAAPNASRVYIQAPALDGGSPWYAETKGDESEPGTIMGLLNGRRGMAGFDWLTVIEGTPRPDRFADRIAA